MTDYIFDIDENDPINKEILEKHINKYLISVSRILVITFLVILIVEIISWFLIKIGCFPYTLENRIGIKIKYESFIKQQLISHILIWISFAIYFITWNKAGFSKRKDLICVLTLIVTTLFCFNHWRNNYLSILYVIPIIITIPLDKKRSKIVSIISILMILFYAVFQYFISNSDINFVVAAIAIITIMALRIIGIKIHNIMNNAFIDIKNYAKKQEILYEKLSHDSLTGAFSKHTFQSDLENISLFNSLAFIDVDNFKSINDSLGHHMGDNILKTLVFCFKSKENKRIYRYGGDEFVILSTFTAKELCEDLKKLKNTFSYYVQKLYNTNSTISVGIINVNIHESGKENLKRCDELMYKSKANGKDTLTVEDS